ncbi:MAG: hypothetical protein V3S55_03880 [Nitrospiraceae bacterium]
MKGYRTLLTNGLIMLFSGVEFSLEAELLADDKSAVIAGALALLNIVYRLYTTTPVGEKK